MKTTPSFLMVLLGSLFLLLQSAIGIPLVPVTETSVLTSVSQNGVRSSAIGARGGPLGTCVDVWEFGRMNRFTPGNPSRSMLNVCTPANTCIQPDAKKGWTHFRSLSFSGGSMGCLLFTQDKCGEGQTLNPATDVMQVVDEWTWGVNQGDEIGDEKVSRRWRSLKCWRTATEKRDAVVSGPVDDAVNAPVVARDAELITVNSGPVAERRENGIDTVLPRFEPLGACVDAYEGRGHSGDASRNMCQPFNQCGHVAYWAYGIRSMGFEGATTCNLYLTLDCSGNQLLQINAYSPGVNMTSGPDFRLGGPWRSFECGRAW